MANNSKILPYISMLRPYQWVKNILVFTGLIFSKSLLEPSNIITSVKTFIVFCLASSAIYVLNDILDIKQDQLHPTKKNRVIASGKVNLSVAKTIMLILIPLSLGLAYLISIYLFIILLAYIVINFAYSFALKRVVILDSMIVSSGFLLRAIAGCVVIHVDVTPWLFVCTLSLALLLSFGKRRNELNLLKENAHGHRKTLDQYNTQLLDIILTICSASAIATYSLYTMATETVNRFGSQKLVITTPFVIYGVFRYLFLIYTRNLGGDPTKLLVRDIPTIVNGVLWIGCILVLIY